MIDKRAELFMIFEDLDDRSNNVGDYSSNGKKRSDGKRKES